MILLDTHLWIWWIHQAPELSEGAGRRIQESEDSGLGLSIISCWEAAKLVERGRLKLPMPFEDWLAQALSYPGILLLDLSPRIVSESIALPGAFHRDPADQLIVATARTYRIPLLTADRLILAYPHVESINARH